MLERILAEAGQVDLILLGGDITNFGSPQNAEKLVALTQARAARVLAVAGNCGLAAEGHYALAEIADDVEVGLHRAG